jgi:hypothetical protein
MRDVEACRGAIALGLKQRPGKSITGLTPRRFPEPNAKYVETT